MNYKIQKPISSLSNGIIVGIGFLGLIVSLVGGLALNAAYFHISNYLLSINVPAITVQSKLEDIINLLSVCPVGFVIGILAIVLGLLNQFSERVRYAYGAKDTMTHMADGLLVGGSVFITLSSGNLLRQYYQVAYQWDNTFITFIVIGVFMLAIGLFLLFVRKPR